MLHWRFDVVSVQAYNCKCYSTLNRICWRVIWEDMPENVSLANIIDNDADSAEDNADEDPAQFKEQACKYRAAQTHQVILPSYSAWSDTSRMHPAERRAVPTGFLNVHNRSKASLIYKDCHDSMIHRYYLRPSKCHVPSLEQCSSSTPRSDYDGLIISAPLTLTLISRH